MAKVPALIDFYNNQNQLSVQTVTKEAEMKSAANIESARLGSEARRLDQEKQLEHFKQMMENLRNARSTASAEKVGQMDIEARKQESILSKTFQGSENAAKMAFDEKLQTMAEAATTQRDLQKTEAGRPLQEAQIEESRAKIAETSRINLKDITDAYSALQKEQKEGGGFLGVGESEGHKARAVTMKLYEDKMAAMGANVETNPDIVGSDWNKEKVQTVAKKLDSEMSGGKWATKMIKKEGEILVRKAYADLTAKLASGFFPTPAKELEAVDRYKKYANSFGASLA